MHGCGQPYATPNLLVPMIIFLVALIVVPTLLWRALGPFISGPLIPRDSAVRSLGQLTGAAALSMYPWGGRAPAPG